MDYTYLVDEIFPAGEIHLIAGASGVGKSTWMMQFLDQWREYKLIFGRKSHPLPYTWCSLDRSLKSMNKTFERVGVLGVPNVDCRGIVELAKVIESGREVCPDAKVFFIESFGLLAPSGVRGDYGNVGLFLTRASRLCEREDITIFASVHLAKTKEGQGYTDPRQKVSGSVAWAAMTDTIVLIERSDPQKLTDNSRKVSVLPRNEAEMEYEYKLDNQGRFILERDRPVEEIMNIVIEKMPKEFSFQDIVIASFDAGVSLASLKRWLTESGTVKRKAHGVYERLV